MIIQQRKKAFNLVASGSRTLGVVVASYSSCCSSSSGIRKQLVDNKKATIVSCCNSNVQQLRTLLGSTISRQFHQRISNNQNVTKLSSNSALSSDDEKQQLGNNEKSKEGGDKNQKNKSKWKRIQNFLFNLLVIYYLIIVYEKYLEKPMKPYMMRFRKFLWHYSQHDTHGKDHANLSFLDRLKYEWMYLFANFIQLLEGTYRFTRVGVVGIGCLWDYLKNMTTDDWDKELEESEKRLQDSLSGKYEEFDESKTLIYQTHKRSATKFLNLFIDLGGIFIKFGQYMSSMTNFLPDAWTETLQVLQDEVPYQADLSEIKLMFEEEFCNHPEFKNKTLEDIFESFEEIPIAAASLAQVHKAKLKKGAIESLKGTELDGSTVAVKIQYPSIRYFYKGDMIAKQAAMEIIHFFFPHYNVSWMGKMLDDTLNQELDFHIEHENSKKIRKLFEKEEEGINQSLYIPQIVSPLSSQRILTMEFIDGWKISDIDSITKNMDHKRMVESAKTTMSIFAKMIFVFGFIHTDPHPGNILVRAHPKNPNHSQVVLLDHGLYQTLDPIFRTKFAKFWRALVMHDKPTIEEYCNELGIEDTQLYASLILMRGYDEKSGIGLSTHGTKAEFETFFKGIIKNRMDKFQQMLRNMPTEMLLIMRTNNLLRYVNQSMGVPVNRYVVNARVASRGMYHSKSLAEILSQHNTDKPSSNNNESISLWNYLKLKYQQHSQNLHFETILFIYEYKQWLWNMWYRMMIHYGFMQPIRVQVDKNDMDVVLAA